MFLEKKAHVYHSYTIYVKLFMLMTIFLSFNNRHSRVPVIVIVIFALNVIRLNYVAIYFIFAWINHHNVLNNTAIYERLFHVFLIYYLLI